MSNEIENKELCDYGCGREAQYIFKNGKHCCESCSAKCPAVKNKVKISNKKNLDKWHENGETLRNHRIDKNKKQRKKYKIDNHGKCDNPGCTNYNDGSYGSGRFCSEHCAYAYAINTTKNSEKRKQHYKFLIENGIFGNKRAPYGTWKCLICQKIFNTRRELKLHMREEHSVISNTVFTAQNDEYICPYCGKTFVKKQSLGGHIVNCKKHPNKSIYDDAHKRAGKTYSNHCKENPYLSGWLGKHHSKETREKISIKRAQQIENEFLDKPYAKVKWYKVKNILNEEYSVRGHWEENVAKRLNNLKILWIKAKYITYVSDITHRYTPDFYIPSLDAYIEVKGRYSDDDKLKMKLVQSQHPDIKIFFLIGKRYHDFINGKIMLSDDILFSNYVE